MKQPNDKLAEIERRIGTYERAIAELSKHLEDDDAAVIALRRCLAIAQQELDTWRRRHRSPTN